MRFGHSASVGVREIISFVHVLTSAGRFFASLRAQDEAGDQSERCDCYCGSRTLFDAFVPRGSPRPHRRVVIEIGAENGAGLVAALRGTADLVITARRASEVADTLDRGGQSAKPCSPSRSALPLSCLCKS